MRLWFYFCKPLTHLDAGMVTNEMHDLPVRCSPSKFARFQPPSCQICQAWAFLDAFGGYLESPNATANGKYCQYSIGDRFYAGLNASFSQRGRNISCLHLLHGRSLQCGYFGSFSSVSVSHELALFASFIGQTQPAVLRPPFCSEESAPEIGIVTCVS